MSIQKSEEVGTEMVPLVKHPARLDSLRAKDLVGSEPITSDLSSEPRVKKERYMVLVLVALLNFSNTVSWIAYAPVSNYVNGYYGENISTWLTTIYMIVSIPLGFFGIWIGSIFGVSVSLVIAAIPNATGALIRALSILMGADSRSYFILMGQGMAAVSYPFIMYLPSKVSDSWFPQSERTLATTVGIMSNPFGIFIANLVAPLIVRSKNDVMLLNYILCALCLIVLFAVMIFVVCCNSSEIKPTQSKKEPYFVSFKSCLTNFSYIILLVTLGGGIGMFNCLYAKMFEMMCPAGHGNHFSGLCASIMIATGIVGATIVGIYVDKKKCFKEATIIFMVCALTAGVLFTWSSRFEGMKGTIAMLIFASLLGFCGLAAYPVGLELAVECTYPVTPEVSSGLVVICGQVLGVAFITILQSFSEKFNDDAIKESKDVCRAYPEDTGNYPRDYTFSLMIITGIAVVAGVLVLFIRPEYKRSDAENRKHRDIHTDTVQTKMIEDQTSIKKNEVISE